MRIETLGFRSCAAGYQLFRQQALAEALLNSRRNYEFVISSVAYDANNEALRSCLKTTGVPDFETTWGELFDGRAGFKVWHHQDWVNWVATHGSGGEWDNWLDWVKNRYGYGGPCPRCRTSGR